MKRLSITILICTVVLLGISACTRSASTAPDGAGLPTSISPDNNIFGQPTLPPIEFPIQPAVTTPEPVVQVTPLPAVVTQVVVPDTAQASGGSFEGVPATYLLQKGEFPFCIARRYNVDPFELLQINHLTLGQIFYPGLVLTMPTSGALFPAPRALHSHTDTYTVTSSLETLRTIACYFGDVDPDALASTNGLANADVPLTAGKILTVP